MPSSPTTAPAGARPSTRCRLPLRRRLRPSRRFRPSRRRRFRSRFIRLGNAVAGGGRHLVKPDTSREQGAHDAFHLHYRRRGVVPGQGAGLGGSGGVPAGARLQGPAQEARPLSQRRSGHHEPLSAR
ncbi:hypothetical protein MTBLM5_10310 [Magnetospirillum sp. LM-5]|nr:hypothetical protein MTBLM5_10310 [Magnetospirillum sp. LM-5]